MLFRLVLFLFFCFWHLFYGPNSISVSFSFPFRARVWHL